jgi:hypothetical protein
LVSLPLPELLAAAALLVGCGESADPTKTVPAWQSVLERFQASTAIFALTYDAEPPEGTTLRMALHEQGADEACDLYKGESQATLPEFWFVAIKLSGVAPGDYRVVTDLATASPIPEAFVRLTQVRDGRKAAAYEASSGAVLLRASPRDLAEWDDGLRADGSIDVGFPSNPLHQVECRGEFNVETNAGSSECTCSDDDGNLSICTPEEGRDCCVGSGPPVRFRTMINATQCPWMCISATGLIHNCLELQD